MVAILIVDRERTFLNSVTRKLRLEGYTDLTPVLDSQEALILLKKRSFDIVLLDITLPDMTGLELLRKIKKEHTATRCIVITADHHIQALIKAGKPGDLSRLIKPFRPEELIFALEKIICR